MLAPRGVAVILVSLLVSVATLSTTVLPGYAMAPETWPPSSEMVIAEVVTGGVSASDEYVEIYNAGSGPTDLGGCQLDYVTASGPRRRGRQYLRRRFHWSRVSTCSLRIRRALTRHSPTTLTPGGLRGTGDRWFCAASVVR